MDTLVPGAYLSYEWPPSGASGPWIARWCDLNVTPKVYKQARVGTADDSLDAEGLQVLTYSQASKAAQAKFKEWSRAGILASGGELTQDGPDTEDERRARRDTGNRILTDLKAALNFAQPRNKLRAWERGKFVGAIRL